MHVHYFWHMSDVWSVDYFVIPQRFCYYNVLQLAASINVTRKLSFLEMDNKKLENSPFSRLLLQPRGWWACNFFPSEDSLCIFSSSFDFDHTLLSMLSPPSMPVISIIPLIQGGGQSLSLIHI